MINDLATIDSPKAEVAYPEEHVVKEADFLAYYGSEVVLFLFTIIF
jgi:hypothetical protein